MERRFVELDGARVACFEAGPSDAEAVVLLHGYPSDHRVWRHQLGPLSREHRVIAPDLLGWGESDRPLHLPFDYESEQGRLEGLLDALELERCNLFTHDYGGFLGLGYVQRRPERVRRFAILNSRAQRTFVPAWYATFGLTGVLGRIPGVRSLAARLPFGEINRRGLRHLVRKGVIDEELLEGYVGWMDTREGRRWLLHFFADYRVATRPELGRGLESISCPVAVVWGARDPYLRTDTPNELAARIPGAELTVIEEAGHFVQEEAPEQVNAALLQLMRR